MLLVDLTEELVNGKIGKVSNILGEEIFVNFTIQNSLKSDNSESECLSSLFFIIIIIIIAMIVIIKMLTF
jgi:hypothetical protein